MSPPDDLRSWTELLKTNWEKRASSKSRDFFVASHPGWEDPAVVERYAKGELDLILAGLLDTDLSRMEVLEIGCGPGRLVKLLGPRVRGYTGIDIAQGMIDGAQERCSILDNCRFSICDGVCVPEGARDRSYDLIFAIAVFIHCPRDVILSMVRDAWSLVAPGGELRFQVLADPADPTGIIVPEVNQGLPEPSEVLREEVKLTLRELNAEDRHLVHECYYLGDQFNYDEVPDFFSSLGDAKLSLYRGDIGSIYGRIEKNEADS
jgi:SAM-dependent methyltransferase